MQRLRMLGQAGQCCLAFFGLCWGLFNGEIDIRDFTAVALISDLSSSFPKTTPHSHLGAWRQLFLLLSLPLLGTCCLGHLV